jgi:cysteine desulfurase/selenocysteine lyase
MNAAANRLPWTESSSEPAGFDVFRVRADFPILEVKVHGKPLVYLDNAATSQKPQPVLDVLTHYYTSENANIHRGVHALSELATERHERARAKVQNFIHAADPSEIVFVRGTTEGINLVAQSYGRTHVRAGDEIIISSLEHHSNIVPWQILCEQQGASLRVIPVNDRGELELNEFDKLLSAKTRLVAVAHVSNALGTIVPLRQVIDMAHSKKVPVLVDGAQAAPHLQIDVQGLDADFYVFSGHKMYGPMGIGVVYGKRELLEAMPPYQGGGDMISSVTFEKTLYNKLPYKFEAGTPDVPGAIGLGAAIDYLSAVGLDQISSHEHELLAYGTHSLSSISGVRLLGTAESKAAVISFVVEDVHPHDVGTILDQEGIAIRTGHHCAQPLMQRLGVEATARASFGLYNTKEEVDALADAIQKVREVFA